jgi:hypothetical protein
VHPAACLYDLLSQSKPSAAAAQEMSGPWLSPSFSDGYLEVVGVTGSLHLAQLQVGLAKGIRLAQGRAVRVTVSQATPMQVRRSCRVKRCYDSVREK